MQAAAGAAAAPFNSDGQQQQHDYPACSVAFLYPGAAASAPLTRPAHPSSTLATTAHSPTPRNAFVGTPAYFQAKRWHESYDEEAEGCFKAAAAAAAARRDERLAQRLAHRAETRATARARRAQLRTGPSDMEAIQPWVSREDAAAAAAAEAVKRAAGRMSPARYPHLAAFLAAHTYGLSERLPVQAWIYTWDEEVHGGGALSSF